MHLAPTFHTLYNNLFTIQQTPRPHAGQICHDTPFPSNHKHLSSHTYNLVLCDPPGIDPLTYALPPQCLPPGTPSNVFELQQKQKSQRRNTSRLSHPYIPHSQYSQPHSRVPTGVDLPTHTPPQSIYIQSHSRLLTGVDLLTYNLPPLTIHTASFS